MKRLFFFFYDLVLLLFFIVHLPKSLCTRYGIKRRILKTPPFDLPKGRPIIWLHGVSVGEIKALSTLLPHVRLTYPNAFVLVSSGTTTGKKEAKRSCPLADVCFDLPLDLSWIMRPFVLHIKADLLILVEGDFWLNLIKAVKEKGGSVVVVNGKLSTKSLKRYLLVKPFTNYLLRYIDYYCVQSHDYFKRFLLLGVASHSLQIIGNLKCDIPCVYPSQEKKRDVKQRLDLDETSLVVTLASTHRQEEELLLRMLSPLWSMFPSLKIMIVPRHPHRFHQVARLLKNKGYIFCRFSDPLSITREVKVILVDQMGILPLCYSLSTLVLVGGSFVPKVGGHNIFEPAKMGTATFFGPYIEKQQSFAEILLKAGAGKQLQIDEIAPLIEMHLTCPEILLDMRKKGLALAEKSNGFALSTWQALAPYRPEIEVPSLPED